MAVLNNELRELALAKKTSEFQNYGTGIIIQNTEDGKILLAKRVDTKTYGSPGGKVEIGESVLQGIVRETQEEANIKLKSVGLYDYNFHYDDRNRLWTSFLFICYDCDMGNIKNQESEMEEWGWYSLDEVFELKLFKPFELALERALQLDLLQIGKDYKPGTVIDFAECPNTASGVQDSCLLAYSYHRPQSIFSHGNLFGWD